MIVHLYVRYRDNGSRICDNFGLESQCSVYKFPSVDCRSSAYFLINLKKALCLSSHTQLVATCDVDGSDHLMLAGSN